MTRRVDEWPFHMCLTFSLPSVQTQPPPSFGIRKHVLVNFQVMLHPSPLHELHVWLSGTEFLRATPSISGMISMPHRSPIYILLHPTAKSTSSGAWCGWTADLTEADVEQCRCNQGNAAKYWILWTPQSHWKHFPADGCFFDLYCAGWHISTLPLSLIGLSTL